MRFVLVVGLLLQFFFSANSQHVDSLARAVDSSVKAFNETDRQFQQLQDSIKRVQLQKSLEQNSKNLDVFLADMKEREKKEKRRMYIRLAAALIFLAVLVYGLARKRKIRSKASN